MKTKLLKLLSCALLLSTFSITKGVDADDTYKDVDYESDVLRIVNNGFERVFNSKASRNFEMGSFTKNDSLEFTFEGKSISLYGYKGKEGGNIKVSIDGGTANLISTFVEKKDLYKSLITSFNNLSSGQHTIKIINNENKWCAIDYFSVSVPNATYIRTSNLAQVGDIICSNMTPRGGGNKDLNVIRNEKIYAVGTSGYGPSQYDSFDGSGILENVFYMGYSFDEETLVSKLCYQTGDFWQTGGWFKNGSLHVEALINGTWETLDLLEDINYPNSDDRADFNPCSIYIFKFNQVSCKGIRICGDAGGTEHFVSVSQIEVYQNVDTISLAEGANYRDK